MDISPIKEVRSYNKNSEFKKLKEGRSCYRHLAGNIGVAFFNFLIQNHYLESENHALELTKTGEQYFESIWIDCKKVQKQPGVFVKPCLDWTERTFHLGGNLGKAFFLLCIEKNYVVLYTENRSVGLTNVGEEFFEGFLKVGSVAEKTSTS